MSTLGEKGNHDYGGCHQRGNSIVMNLKDGVLEIADGPPCEASYETFYLKTDAYERIYSLE